jgi:hypothetical protein
MSEGGTSRFSYSAEFWYDVNGAENSDVREAERRSSEARGADALSRMPSSACVKIPPETAYEPVRCGGIGGVLVEEEEGGWIRKFTDCQASH